MSAHLQRLAALADPIVEQALASPAFQEAWLTRCQALALARVAVAADDAVEIGRAAAESPDNGAAMSDALLDDLDPADRQELEERARETLAALVRFAAIAFVAGRIEATLDHAAPFDVDVGTLVAIGLGLGSVVA